VSAPRATERECEDTIIAAARTFGWRVHAERPAQSTKGWRTPVRGDPGWCDLALVRGHEFLLVELKRHPNKLEPEQEKWLAALSFAGVDARVVWCPEQLQEFCQWLADRRPTLRE